jgi:hypothetical protein
MSWWQIFWRALALFKALFQKLSEKEEKTVVKPLPKRPTQEELIRHQKELYRRNHPKKKG